MILLCKLLKYELVGQSPHETDNNSVRQRNHLGASSWGQPQQHTRRQDKGDNNEEEKHDKVHFIYAHILFILPAPQV